MTPHRQVASALGLLAVLSGCANLPTSGDGIVALEVVQPASLTLAQGSSIQLTARAVDRSGTIVAADVRWRTPDSTLVVDSLTGEVTAITDAGTGRVQASTGTLRSSILTFALTAAAPGGVRH